MFLKIGAEANGALAGRGAGTLANAPAVIESSCSSCCCRRRTLCTPPLTAGYPDRQPVYWAGVYRPAAMSTFWRALASRAFRRAAVLRCSTPLLTALSITAGAGGQRSAVSASSIGHGSGTCMADSCSRWYRHVVRRCATNGLLQRALCKPCLQASSASQVHNGLLATILTLVRLVDQGLHGGQVSLGRGRGGLERVQSGQHLQAVKH